MQYVEPRDYDGVYLRKLHRTVLDAIEDEVVADSEVTKLRCTGVLQRGDKEFFRDLLVSSMPSTTLPIILLDLGCGTGGLGVWMADKLKAGLVGVDFSSVAICLARRRMPQRHRHVQKRFIVTEFQNTGLEESSVSACLSLDSLYLAKHPATVLSELQRVMLRRSPLIFTYYSSSSGEENWLGPLAAAGFDVLTTTDLTLGWREHMRRKHLRRWASRFAITEALGDFAEHELSVTASMLGLGNRKSFIDSTERYLIHAIRR